MVRKVQVVLQDDLDGSVPAQRIHFSLDGKDYEIDLNEVHAAELHDSLAPWVSAGRRVTAPGGSDARSKGHSRPANPVDIRRWAEENGIPVAARGRLSIDLRSRYQAAH